MPGGDRTGPAGAGPMTGRGMGTCASTSGFVTGGGFGRGMGRGFRNRRFVQQSVAPNKEDQVIALRTQMDRLNRQIEVLENT